MKLDNLLEKCENAYCNREYERLIELCDEVLKTDSKNRRAFGYKSAAYCFLNHPEKALEILSEACKLYPDDYNLKNNAAMAYYAIGEYEKSLKCCEEALKISDFDGLYENRIKALLKLERIDDAIECYENSSAYFEITDLMIDAGKYSQALKYCLEENPDDFEMIVDEIKKKDTSEIGDYYISWIYKIRFRYNTKTCPDCGGNLISILYGYPTEECLRMANRGEIFLGGCCIPMDYTNYRCRNCGHEFYLGYNGLHIECDDFKLNEYTKYKIREITSKLKKGSELLIKSCSELKKELEGFDDEEFNAFVSHLIEIGYIYQSGEGHIRLAL